MKLAIFGGSGVVGQALLPRLLAAGHTLRAMRHRSALSVEDVEVVEGSITDATAVAETIGDADVVLQLTKGGDGIEQAVETSVRGTITVLDAIGRSPGVTQYLLTSSDAATGIWQHRLRRPISHRTRPASYPGYYSLGKVLEEVIVNEYRRNGSLPYTIARLSYVQQDDSALRQFIANYDPKRPGRGPFDSAYSAEQRQHLKQGQPFVVLPCGKDGEPLGRTLVQREDVVDGLLAMVGSAKALGQVFHLSGPGFGYDRPCAYLAEKLGLPVERVRLTDAYSFDIDVSHTTRQLGWSPKFDVIAMLEAALAWREAHTS